MTHDALRLARAGQPDGDIELSPLCRSIVDGEHQNISRVDRVMMT